jgi:ribosomal protein S18 acetylase RimI-like enzyme
MRLAPVDRAQVHGCFQAAFADYGVNMSYMTEENLLLRAAKNAVDWDLSVGSFDESGHMVGFTLIGVDDWGGERSAFDAATGIVPDHRGAGLARAMLDHALPALRERGVIRFVLEVIQGNDRAIRAYRKAGFEVARELACFDLHVDPRAAATRVDAPFEVRDADRSILDELEGEAEWLPSWENSFAAIRRVPDELIVLGAYDGGEPVGAVVFTPALGWIMSIVTARTHRRLGVATELLRRLAERVGPRLGGSPLRLVNVDRSDTGMIALAERCGFTHRLDQLEMMRSIQRFSPLDGSTLMDQPSGSPRDSGSHGS